MKILGVSRSPRFSPNSTDRDAAIFQAVRLGLLQKGHEVLCCCEDDLDGLKPELPQFPLVFTMARDKEVLSFLAAREAGGARVVNSPAALLKYTRGALFHLFYEAGLPVPRTCCVHRSETGGLELEKLNFPLWIKRSDECAQVKDDVRFVYVPAEVREVCNDYFSRGVEEALLCEHIEGELLKFYGVRGTGFFRVYSTDTRHGFSKFGLEHTNKFTSHHAFDEDALKDSAERAASLSGISVYGGDAVVNEQGVYIIDFNDWPSFSAYRDEAARAIVKCLLANK